MSPTFSGVSWPSSPFSMGGEPVPSWMVASMAVIWMKAGLLAGRLPAKTVAGRASMASCGTTWVGRASG